MNQGERLKTIRMVHQAHISGVPTGMDFGSGQSNPNLGLSPNQGVLNSAGCRPFPHDTVDTPRYRRPFPPFRVPVEKTRPHGPDRLPGGPPPGCGPYAPPALCRHACGDRCPNPPLRRAGRVAGCPQPIEGPGPRLRPGPAAGRHGAPQRRSGANRGDSAPAAGRRRPAVPSKGKGERTCN